MVNAREESLSEKLIAHSKVDVDLDYEQTLAGWIAHAKRLEARVNLLVNLRDEALASFSQVDCENHRLRQQLGTAK